MSLKHWEAFYRTGALATTPTTQAGGFDKELLEVWVSFFESLPSGSRILDLGTGNGALLLLAAELAERLACQWDLHGVDLAQIDPVRDLPEPMASRLRTCHFYPATAIEKLPFDDRCFDAACGSYALEYADAVPALSELARVLKPTGQAQFLIHHASSRLADNARQSLLEADQVLNRTKIYRHVKNLFAQPNHAARIDGRETLALRQAIAELRAAHRAATAQGGGRVLAVTLDSVRQLLEARPDLGSVRASLEVERVEEELRHSVRRLKDLLETARDQAGIEQMASQAKAAGFKILELNPQYHDSSNLVGWRLCLQRI